MEIIMQWTCVDLYGPASAFAKRNRAEKKRRSEKIWKLFRWKAWSVVSRFESGLKREAKHFVSFDKLSLPPFLPLLPVFSNDSLYPRRFTAKREDEKEYK